VTFAFYKLVLKYNFRDPISVLYQYDKLNFKTAFPPEFEDPNYKPDYVIISTGLWEIAFRPIHLFLEAIPVYAKIVKKLSDQRNVKVIWGISPPAHITDKQNYNPNMGLATAYVHIHEACHQNGIEFFDFYGLLHPLRSQSYDGVHYNYYAMFHAANTLLNRIYNPDTSQQYSTKYLSQASAQICGLAAFACLVILWSCVEGFHYQPSKVF